MTRPDGEIRADLRIDTDKVADDVDDGLDKAGRRAERDFKDLGKKFGDATADGIGEKLEASGPRLARSVQRGMDKETVVSKITYELDENEKVRRTWVTRVARDMERAVKDSVTTGGGRGGGPFGKVGAAIADAIGAGFNVTGRSPLIYLLIPVIGYIAALIVGLVQAISGLTAILFTIPGALAAIAISAGVAFLAFQGLGTAIEGAFKAENAEQLNEAIKDLTPSAQEFVKSLLPLEDVFKELRRIAQEGFFAEFGDTLTQIATVITPTLAGTIGEISRGLGSLASTLVASFGTSEFQRFLEVIGPSTRKWFEDLGYSLLEVSKGFSAIGVAAEPFLTWLGEKLNTALADFGQWLQDLSEDPEFLAWLEEMKGTLKELWFVLSEAGRFIFSVFNALRKAGGDKLLHTLGVQLQFLTAFFESEAGVKAMEGLIHTVTALSWAFIALVAIFGLFFTGLEIILEWIRYDFWPWLENFITNTIPEAAQAVVGFFSTIGTSIGEFWWFIITTIGGFFAWIVKGLFTIAAEIIRFFQNSRVRVVQVLSELPGEILAAVSGFGTLLVQAGINLIQGLINGIFAMFPSLRSVMTSLGSVIRRYVPFSPAEEGPLSGEGDPMKSGQEIIRRLAVGMEMEAPALAAASNSAMSQVFLGPGAVQMNFSGIPTMSQANGIGQAAGNGLADQLAMRNTRLAVRTL